METQRLIRRIRNLPNNLEKAYINDISNIIDKLLEEYDIFYKDTNERVKRSILVNRFKLDLLDKQEEEIFCAGFSKNGNKCVNKTFEDSKYCKRHHYLTFKERFEDINAKSNIIMLDHNLHLDNSDNDNKSKLHDVDLKNLKQKFINDTFYYVDENFIYERDMQNDMLKKVGYIENETFEENGEKKITKNFVLTDDPFILSA